EPLVNSVDVDRYGDSVAPRDRRGVGDGRRVVAVDVKESGAGDLLGRDLFRVDAEAVASLPEDRPLAGGAADDDICRLVGAVAPKLDVFEVDACASQALYLNPAALVIADRADVLRAESEAGARDEGAGHLASGTEKLFDKRDFSRIRRKVRN